MFSWRFKPTVFISYRRDGGSELARLLYEALTRRGYSTFFDVETLRSGPFDAALYRRIEDAVDVVVVLPPNSLDRCRNEGDWFRLEIAHALSRKKNVVPVMMPGFVWPEAIPNDIAAVRQMNGIAPSHSMFEESVGRLVKLLHSWPLMRWMRYATAGCIAAAILAFLMFSKGKSPNDLPTGPAAVAAPQVAPSSNNATSAEVKRTPADATRDVLGRRHAVADRLRIPLTKSNSFGMQFNLIPDGVYYMGSDDGDANERPVHRVELRRPFFLATYETTQNQYETILGENPSGFRGQDLPVEMVAWEDAVRFCEELSRRESQRYRLPTEAEWEWACRGGTLAAWSFGDDVGELGRYGWTQENADNITHPVGRKSANPLGLYDMHGNVWEFCSDWYAQYQPDPVADPLGPASGAYRTYRGGSYFFPAHESRSTNRPDRKYPPKGTNLGFRVVLEIDSGTP